MSVGIARRLGHESTWDGRSFQSMEIVTQSQLSPQRRCHKSSLETVNSSESQVLYVAVAMK